MSGVKRYTVQAAFTGSVAEPTEIVLASDYDTLRAANQRLEVKCSLLDTARIEAEEKQWAAERENRRLEGEVKSLIVLLDRAAVVAGLYGDSLIGRAQQDEGYKMLDFERELRDALAALRGNGGDV